MPKTGLLAACCLSIVFSTSTGASAQQLPAPAHAMCLARTSSTQVVSLASKPVAATTCGLQCFANEGGTTSTYSGFGGTCAESASGLQTALTSAADSACRSLTGLRACKVVVYADGCTLDGDPDYYIDTGYATYGCMDTTC